MSSSLQTEILISFVNNIFSEKAYIPYTIGYSYDPTDLTTLFEKILKISLSANGYFRDTNPGKFSVVYATSKEATSEKTASLRDLVDLGFGTFKKPLYAHLIKN